MKKGPVGGMKPSLQAMIGQTFGRWLVVGYGGTTGKHYRPVFDCRCECGTERKVQAEYLRNGRSQSCGCLHKEIVGKTFTTHGHSINRKPTPTYRTWQDMFTRCYLKHRKDYKWYGALGVRVCERWNDFENFLADMGERPEGMTIDRIDPRGNYEPSNCRWANWETQAENKRKNMA